MHGSRYVSASYVQRVYKPIYTYTYVRAVLRHIMIISINNLQGHIKLLPFIKKDEQFDPTYLYKKRVISQSAILNYYVMKKS